MIYTCPLCNHWSVMYCDGAMRCGWHECNAVLLLGEWVGHKEAGVTILVGSHCLIGEDA